MEPHKKLVTLADEYVLIPQTFKVKLNYVGIFSRPNGSRGKSYNIPVESEQVKNSLQMKGEKKKTINYMFLLWECGTYF